MTTNSERIETLEQQVRMLAWLHNELVHELRVLIATQLAPGAARNPAVVERAKRIAAIRDKQRKGA